MPTFRLTAAGVGGLVGAAVAFVQVAAVVVFVWVMAGAVFGAAIGFGVARLGRAERARARRRLS